MNEHAPSHDLESSLAGLAHGMELIATRRLGCRADGSDAAQETLVRVLERIRAGAIADRDELARVAYGILRHVIADIHRLRAREVSAIDDLQSNGPCPLDRMVIDDERSAVHSALGQLSEADRALLERCFVNGERVVAIAAALGEPPERVRKRKSRALERLATLLPGTARRHAGSTTATPVSAA